MSQILPPSAEAAARQLGNTAADHFEATAKQQFASRISQFVEAGGFSSMFGQILVEKLAPVQADLDRACQNFGHLPKDNRGQGFGKRGLGSATIDVDAK